LNALANTPMIAGFTTIFAVVFPQQAIKQGHNTLLPGSSLETSNGEIKKTIQAIYTMKGTFLKSDGSMMKRPCCRNPINER